MAYSSLIELVAVSTDYCLREFRNSLMRSVFRELVPSVAGFKVFSLGICFENLTKAIQGPVILSFISSVTRAILRFGGRSHPAASVACLICC